MHPRNTGATADFQEGQMTEGQLTQEVGIVTTLFLCACTCPCHKYAGAHATSEHATGL